MRTSFIPGPIDEATRLEAAATTKTSTFNGTALDLGSGFAPGGHGQAMSVVLDASARDFTTTDETYTLTVQESDDNSTFTDASPAVSIAGTGVTSVPAFISKRYVRGKLTLGGTSPSITYESWLVAHQP